MVDLLNLLIDFLTAEIFDKPPSHFEKTIYCCASNALLTKE